MSDLTLDEAAELTRTGDLWLFRGSTVADKAIRMATNAPVNHVGMAVVIDDLPPLMFHAEMGKHLTDVWTMQNRRGVQLHDLRASVEQWCVRYQQQGWLRQLEPEVTQAQEDAVIMTIDKLDGNAFPSTLGLARRFLRGRFTHGASAEQTYCAEVVATTYAAMGLLPADRNSNEYAPGSFWSGSHEKLLGGAQLGKEIKVIGPTPQGPAPSARERSR